MGGNELQPAQENDMMLIVAHNVVSLFFQTYLMGNISVLIALMVMKYSAYQDEIDIVNQAMKNENLSPALQTQIRDYYIKVQETMGAQIELTRFFELISNPLRIAVQQEMFSSKLEQKNLTIGKARRRVV